MGWVGVAVIAASWLFGLGYYHEADLKTWAALLIVASVCFFWLPTSSLPGRRVHVLALLLILPTLLVAPWPYGAACWFLFLACVLQVVGPPTDRLPRVRRRLDRVTHALLFAGGLLLVQGIAVFAYVAFTSRDHDLPAPLPAMIGQVAGLLDIDVAVHDKTVSLHSMRQIHSLGATWELLLDPVTCCFLASLFATCVLVFWRGDSESRRALVVRSLVTFIILVVVWLPLRSGLLIALFLHDVLRTDYAANLNAMRLFWNPWLHLLLLAGPVAVCWRFWPSRAVAIAPETVGPDVRINKSASRFLTGGCLCGLGVASFTFGVLWDPIGVRQQGRVLVEEYHPDPEEIWEPTFKPYDTNWYGQKAGYNYACIYDYCSRFYDMSRQTSPLSSDALQDSDVLIVKVPTRRFAPTEVDAIEGFVRRGGGLLLIGEHTNVYKTSDYLNPIAARFGFQFRNDCLFGIDMVFEQLYRTPSIPHPIVQRMPPMSFATSCSIDPGFSPGRGVIVGTGLKNLEADYHANNYYPQPDNLAEMRYGSFVQLWATRYGEGRVVAFTDSTIFSNFSTFEPGKSELMMGMIEWLNHRSTLGNTRPFFVVVGTVLLLIGLAVARPFTAECVLLLACCLCGWAVAVVGVRTLNSQGMPLPRAISPLVQVNIDQTACSSPLAKNGFVDGTEDGFGIFERWILRLGYFTARREGARVFDGDVAVFFRPNQRVGGRFLQEMREFVEAGGKLLIVDSARTDSTSNSLLEPFGLAVDYQQVVTGTLQTVERLPEVEVVDSVVTRGGEPFAWIDGQPVGTMAREGKGAVTVIGFGSRLTDASMGRTADVEPNEELRNVFELHFGLLRSIVESDQ